VRALNSTPHLVVVPEVAADLPRKTSQCSSDWSVAEGVAKTPTNNSPDHTANGKAKGVEEDSQNTGVDGDHMSVKEKNTARERR
jgi:hypothetical protein